uniref:Serine/threonine-protein phosphatase n=1 Tax=Globodera rostochiensis TaxID=31243 RepID=A0A914H3S9_GLORO
MEPTRGPLSTGQLDVIIAKLLRTTVQDFTQDVSQEDVQRVCATTVDVLKSQPSLVEIAPPVVVCGDIHGQFADLLKIFATIGFPPNKKYLFLGDFVDRGPRSLETAVLLFCFKARYPESFFVLRGNHECSNINRLYGFYEEIARRFGQADSERIWILFNQTFAWLPYVGLVANRILCMHGGISPEMNSLRQLRELHRPSLDPPNPSLELNILWADPAQGIQGIRPNPRGISILFGEDVLTSVCKQLKIDLVVRAHQCVQYGAEFFGNRKLVTLFSAPRYEMQDNVGATLTIEMSPNLRCIFRFFAPTANNDDR